MVLIEVTIYHQLSSLIIVNSLFNDCDIISQRVIEDFM